MKKKYERPSVELFSGCEYCVICGAPIPEGWQVCPVCEFKINNYD